MRGGGARSRIAPRVFSTNSCEEFPKAAGSGPKSTSSAGAHRKRAAAGRKKGEVGVQWGDSIAGLPRGAGVRARDARLVLYFSEMAQALREAQDGDRAQLGRLVAAVRSLYELCVLAVHDSIHRTR